MKQEINLRNYLEEKKISVTDFVKITGVDVATVYRIMANPNWNASVKHIRMIYQSTLAKYGKGLDIWEYLNK